MPKYVYKKRTDKKLEEVGILPSLTEWNGKSDVGHTHAISDVTNLQSALNEKANSSHTHSISQITNLQTSLDVKLDKTTYEWNKEFAAGSNGAISLGRYNIYDSQLTFDITSTTNQSISGKLVIATQNGTIHQAKVFGDASGTLVSKLIIYQSAISNSRSWVEIFCNFNGWSKNKVHIYAVALNSATVQKQMTSVSISNGVPAAANVTSGDTKWTGTIVNDFNHSHGNYVTTNTAQTISAKKTFSATPALSAIKNKKVIGTDANGLIEAHTLGIDDITDLKTQLNGKQPSGAYAERQSAQTITGNWTFTGTANFNGTTKVNGNEIASKGYVDGIFDSKLNASEATNFAKFTKFDSDTLKMTGARLYRTSAGDAVDRSSMYGYSSQNTHGTTYTRFAGMATIGSSQAFIGYYQYTNHADGSGGEYIGNITLSNGRLARINGSLSSVNELTDAYAVLSDLNNKANKTHTHAISDITNLQSTLNGKQATLVSGTNIKTINGNSILGSGNLSISADLSRGYDYEGFDTGFYNTQYDRKNLLNLSSATIQGDNVYKWGTVINVTPNDKSSMVQFYVPDGVGRDGYNHRLLVRSGWGLDSSKMANWQKTTAWEQILTRNTCPKAFTDIINSTTTKSAYCQIGDLLIQWGVFIGAHGDTTNWTVTYPKTFFWYPSVILQTKDTNTNNQGLPYSNGAVITNYNNGTSFTFQLRRSESCPVYWIAIGGLS